MQMSAALMLIDGDEMVMSGNAHIPGEAFDRTPNGTRYKIPATGGPDLEMLARGPPLTGTSSPATRPRVASSFEAFVPA